MTIANCPHCGYGNDSAAIVCLSCYAILKPFGINRPSTTLHSSMLETPDAENGQPNRIPDFGKTLSPNTVALLIAESPEPIYLKIAKDAFLGRKSESIKVHPLLDLTIFQAFDRGVSRLHAVLRRAGSEIVLEDLGSSNGTWLNETRLAPRDPKPLQSGDRIMLGSLPMVIYLRPNEPPLSGQGSGTLGNLKLPALVTRPFDDAPPHEPDEPLPSVPEMKVAPHRCLRRHVHKASFPSSHRPLRKHPKDSRRRPRKIHRLNRRFREVRRG